MASVNSALDRLFDLLFLPLRGWPLEISLALFAAITATGLLVVFKLTSNQGRLRATRRQVYADLLEIRLFKDEPRVMLASLGGVVTHQATYLRLSLGPLLWSAAPMTLLIVQLQAYFGYAGPMIHEPVLVTTQFDGPLGDAAALVAPEGLVVSTPDVNFPQLHQIVWRVIPESAGDYVVTVRIGSSSYHKTLLVSGDAVARRSPRRERAGWFASLMAPSEMPLDTSSTLSAITVGYADRHILIFNRTFHWMAIYLVELIAFMMVLKRPLRVTF